MYKNKLTKKDLAALETNALMDLLAEYTTNYTKMLTRGVTNEEFVACEIFIDMLQSEIISRSKQAGNKK